MRGSKVLGGTLETCTKIREGLSLALDLLYLWDHLLQFLHREEPPTPLGSQIYPKDKDSFIGETNLPKERSS